MTLVMDAGIKAELVSRLRSGKYVQGKEKLSVMDKDGEQKFCCLGVLCEIAVERGIIPRIEYDEDVWDACEPQGLRTRTSYKYDGYDAVLPPKVVEWADVRSIDIDGRPEVTGFDDYEGMGRFEQEGSAEHTSLAEMNDSGVSFRTIANFIEEKVGDA